MRGVLILTTFLLFVANSLQDDDLNDDQYCVYGCQESLWTAVYTTTEPTDDYWTGYCSDTLRFTSTYLCAKLHCTKKEITAGIEYLKDLCKEYSNIDILPYDAVANWTIKDIEKLRVVVRDELKPTDIIDTPILPSQELFDLAVRTWVDWYFEYHLARTYGFAMWGFWGITLLTGLGYRLLAIATARKRKNSRLDAEDLNAPRSANRGLISRVITWSRRKLILPATFGFHHIQPVWWSTIPTRIQSIQVFLFVLINIVLCAASYRSFLHHIYWDSNALQLWRYVSDRAGIIAYANLPFVWLFAGRNNIFLWLTGWNYGTYNVFHRWVARVVTAEAIVHSIGYTAFVWSESNEETLRESFAEEYWYTGVIATVTMSFVLIFSILPLRQKVYELFLELHVVLALIALVCLFYHTKEYEHYLYQNPFLWPCVALWCFDYAVRLGRLVVLNWRLLFFSHTKAIAVYDEKQDLIRLTVTPSFHLRPQPGTHYFLYFPTLFLAKGNHPFTMSHWTVPGMQLVSAPPSPTGGVSKEEMVVTSETISRDSSSGSDNPSSVTQTSIEFLIRPYKGLTRNLRKSIRASNTLQKSLTVLIEGPYGHPAPVFDFNTILFIVGGTGITPVLAYLQEYLTNTDKTKITTQNIHIIWAVREADFVRGVLNHELRAARGNASVQIDVFLTRDESGKVSKTDGDTDLGPVISEGYEWANFHHGRPVVTTVIKEKVESVASTLAVLVCGPASLADEARTTMAAHASSGIEYFEEQFGW